MAESSSIYSFTRILLGALAGGAGAFLVFHFLSCSGICPISTSPYAVALLGGLVGLVASIP